jgi:dihydrofolate reductase
MGAFLRDQVSLPCSNIFMTVKFISISALGHNREIGLNGKIPWDLPDEYAHYQKTVKGQHVLIGRKNFELNKGDFPHSSPIVLSRNADFEASGAVVVKDMNEVIEHAREHKIEVIYVIGGAWIYDLTLPYISEFYCSIVDYEGPADTYFPQYMSYEWEVDATEIHEKWTLYHMIKRPDFTT